MNGEYGSVVDVARVDELIEERARRILDVDRPGGGFELGGSERVRERVREERAQRFHR